MNKKLLFGLILFFLASHNIMAQVKNSGNDSIKVYNKIKQYIIHSPDEQIPIATPIIIVPPYPHRNRVLLPLRYSSLHGQTPGSQIP